MDDKIIGEIQKQIANATYPLGGYIGYAAIAAAILTLIAIILLLMFKSSLQSAVNHLIKNTNEQKDKIGKIPLLEDELIKSKNEIRELKNRLETFERKYSENQNRNQNLVDNNKSMISAFSAEQSTQTIQSVQAKVPPPPPPQPTIREKSEQFLVDCNALANKESNNLVDFRKSRDEFLSKYRIKGFNCKNFNERMNNPSIAPEFESFQATANSEYWAYAVENDVYAVVPNVKSYNGNYHSARAMGVVFRSNFNKGSNYGKIRVIKPAIFRSMWNLSEPGELALS